MAFRTLHSREHHVIGHRLKPAQLDVTITLHS
jgi:hypothetical protein